MQINFRTRTVSYTEYFGSGNEPDRIENATHNTFAKLTWIFVFCLLFFSPLFKMDLSIVIPVHVGISGANRTHLALTFI
jgi:hypothetical protein